MSSQPPHRRIAWFQIVVGIAVIGWWALAASSDGIEELNDGRTDILFHIAAELTMAWLLVVAGISLLRHGLTSGAATLSALALGALAYSSMNSPGYFAERGEWWAVGMFAAIGTAAAVTAVKIATSSHGRRSRSGLEPRLRVRSDAMTQPPRTPDDDRRIASAR